MAIKFPQGLPVIPRWLVIALLVFSVFFIFLRISSCSENSRNDLVVGNLGGVPVEIPRAYTRFVEYNQASSFLEYISAVFLKRSYDSKLRGFAFETRYPDMASAEVKTKADEDIFSTMWMRVLIDSGENYGSSGDEALENHKKWYLDKRHTCLSRNKCFVYIPLPDKTFGLTGYTPTGTGVDESLRNINGGLGTDYRDRNIYFYQDEAGRVMTFVVCGNRTHGAERCEQYFNLNPVMKAHVKVNYRKELLPHWQKIQSSVTKLIYSFEY
ncbi:MAG: hypothetical protein ACOY41_03180 [Pseudomonadota bacterium]